MKITFWGVRGSLPSPGPSTVRYGGNTPCVSVELDSNKVVVLDAGTGIRSLGKALAKGGAEIFILVTHNHWDHVQGFPFFLPIYQTDRPITVFAVSTAHRLLCSLVEQMDGAHFPIPPEKLPSQTQCILEDAITFLGRHGFNLSRIAINHPGGGFGYRFMEGGRSLVYLTDNELHPPGPTTTRMDQFVEFCHGARILIHDAQYVEADMPHKHGWGHSQVRQAVDLAAAANVEHLILFHHDPDRTDEELDTIQDQARSYLHRLNPNLRCTVAFEGLTLDL